MAKTYNCHNRCSKTITSKPSAAIRPISKQIERSWVQTPFQAKLNIIKIFPRTPTERRSQLAERDVSQEEDATKNDVDGDDNLMLYYNSVNNKISNNINLKSINNNFIGGNKLARIVVQQLKRYCLITEAHVPTTNRTYRKNWLNLMS